MAYVKLDMLKEQRLLARGRKTHTNRRFIVEWARDYVAATLPKTGDSIEWCEALWQLKDPRIN